MCKRRQLINFLWQQHPAITSIVPSLIILFYRTKLVVLVFARLHVLVHRDATARVGIFHYFSPVYVNSHLQWASCRKRRWIRFAKHWTFMILLFSSSGPHHPAVGSPRTKERQKPRNKTYVIGILPRGWKCFFVIFANYWKGGKKNWFCSIMFYVYQVMV